MKILLLCLIFSKLSYAYIKQPKYAVVYKGGEEVEVYLENFKFDDFHAFLCKFEQHNDLSITWGEQGFRTSRKYYVIVGKNQYKIKAIRSVAAYFPHEYDGLPPACSLGLTAIGDFSIQLEEIHTHANITLSYNATDTSADMTWIKINDNSNEYMGRILKNW